MEANFRVMYPAFEKKLLNGRTFAAVLTLLCFEIEEPTKYSIDLIS